MGLESGTDVISKEFLEKSLKRKVESFTVKSGSNVGDNYMSIMYALEVVVVDKENNKETLHLISKCYPSHPSRQEYLNNSNIFWNELSVYNTWIPTLKTFQVDMGIKDILKPSFPPFACGSALDFCENQDENNNKDPIHRKVYGTFENYIMMVDLRKTWGYRMANRFKGLDRAHYSLAIVEYAKIHALSWAYKQKNNIDNIREKFPFLHYDLSDPANKELFSQLLLTNFSNTLKILESTFGTDSGVYKGTEAFKGIGTNVVDTCFGGGTEDTLDQYLRIKSTKDSDSSEAEKPWRVILHGDSWINNMLFRYDERTQIPVEVAFVDLQLCRDGCPTLDLAYFTYASTDGEFRKKYLDEMLELYHDKFNYFCKKLNSEVLPGFTVASLKYRFRRAKFFGFCMAQMVLPIMLKAADKAVDMDANEDTSIGMTDILLTIAEMKEENPLFRKRIIEIATELYDEGII